MSKQTQKVSEYELPVNIEPQKEGGFVVTSPLWKDCFAQGDTVDEAILEITAVAQSLIELYKEESLKIPLKVHKNVSTYNSSLNLPIIVAV